MEKPEEFQGVVSINSDTEFVIVVRFRHGYRPLFISQNCGAELLGFASTVGGKLSTASNEQNVPIDVLRHIEGSQYHALAFNLRGDLIEEISGDRAAIYWKGPKPERLDKLREACEVGVSLLLTSQDFREANHSYLSWFLGPIVLAIESEHIDREKRLERRKAIQNRDDRIRMMLASVALVLAIVAAFSFIATNLAF